MNNFIMRSNYGYTFIELLIALTILGLLISPVLMMFSGSFLSIKNAGNHSTAVNLCRQQMEKVKSLGYDSALDLFSLEHSNSNAPEENINNFPGFKRVTTVSPYILTCTNKPDLNAELLLIEITVTWNEGGTEKMETLSSLLSRR